jgi:Nitroreductase family
VEFSEVIRKRRMVRAFTGEPVDPQAAHRILTAANRAPSAIDPFRQLFGVPGQYTPIGAVAIGHPDPTVAAAHQGGSSRVIKRRELAELVHRGRW